MYRIYGYSTFNPLKVVAAAEEIGVEYDYVFVNLGKRENTEPEHLARHPLGKVPVLETDGQFIFESAAICRYLARAHDNRLYSDDLLQAARIDQTMDTLSVHTGRWLSVYFWEEVIKPKFFEQEPDPEKIAEARSWLEKQLPYLDSMAEKHEFLCGDEISIADTFAFSYLAISDNTSVDLTPYPNLNRWYQAVHARPTIKKAMEQVFSH